MKASYIALAIFSLIPAVIFIFYSDLLAKLSYAGDLVLVTVFFLILDAVLSLILAFTEDKVERSSEQAERKG
jgi:hypothetical protein